MVADLRKEMALKEEEEDTWMSTGKSDKRYQIAGHYNKHMESFTILKRQTVSFTNWADMRTKLVWESVVHFLLLAKQD